MSLRRRDDRSPLARLIIGVTAFLLTASCAALGRPSPEVVSVSLINLIATPERYDGRVVQTSGIATIAFESDAVYLSREDAAEGAIPNSIHLTFEDGDVPRDQVTALDKRRVLVVGNFERYASEGFT